MAESTNNNALSMAVYPLAYAGVNPRTPPNFLFYPRAPTVNDTSNVKVGWFWLNTSGHNPPTINDVYILVSLAGGTATWVPFSGGSIIVETLTANSGGAVGPTANNINVVGDGTTITASGNPGTSTITFSVIGTGVVSTLTGNSGGAVSPTAGNTNIVGSGVITVVGNPGTSTLTVTPSGAIASSFPTDSGTATPSVGVLNVNGGTSARDINTSGSGHTIHIDLNNAITLGDLSAIGAGSGALTATTGDVIITAGNLQMPATNVGGTAGVVTLGGSKFIYAAATSESTFVGVNSGSFTPGARSSGFGFLALQSITTSADSTGIGSDCLGSLTTGAQNTGLGSQAGGTITTGANNTFLGFQAGSSYATSDSNNITIGALVGGTAGQSNRLIIGGGTGAGSGQIAKSFISGIRGVTTDSADAIAVLISSTGQLGTVSSSIKVKENVQDMSKHSSFLSKLRPVIFNFVDDVNKVKRYGLIAEEVLEVCEDLVAFDKDGQPMSVKYHDLPALLLNELQKLTARVEELEKKQQS